MARVDLPYFKEIVSRIDRNKTNWVIGYYKIEEIENKRKTMIDLGINTSLVQFQ